MKAFIFLKTFLTEMCSSNMRCEPGIRKGCPYISHCHIKLDRLLRGVWVILLIYINENHTTGTSHLSYVGQPWYINMVTMFSGGLHSCGHGREALKSRWWWTLFETLADHVSTLL